MSLLVNVHRTAAAMLVFSTLACAGAGGDQTGGTGGEGGHTQPDAAGGWVDARESGESDEPKRDEDAGEVRAKDASSPLDLARGSDGGGSNAGSPDAAPTVASEFVAGENIWREANRSTGTLTFAVKNAAAADNAVVELMVPGNPAFGPADHAGPAYANEIATKQALSYGVYRVRVQLAACQPTEELVNGMFTYFNDGKDHNGNGIIDNSEIDIEILCSNPAKISLTSWTDYAENPETFIKKGRTVDFATGDYYEDVVDNAYGQAKVGNLPAFRHPGFPDPGAFYEMGFEWHANALRYFIVVDGQEVTLWNMTEETYVPKLPAPFLLNLWHSQSDWWTGKDSDYPATSATMRVDWFRYWKD